MCGGEEIDREHYVCWRKYWDRYGNDCRNRAHDDGAYVSDLVDRCGSGRDLCSDLDV